MTTTITRIKNSYTNDGLLNYNSGSPSADDGFNFLNDYRIIKTIGTGTFGRVSLVQKEDTGTFYAVKIMAVRDVIKLKQTEHVENEKAILKQVNHPFIVKLNYTGHDSTFLYMILEYIGGGELFSYLRTAGKFSFLISQFYAAEIVLALQYLHNLNIVYRDLKPENLLINSDGHLKITDFGFAKKLKDRTWTICGTPEYLAPEIIQSRGHNKAVDWWALGILIYEMMVGFPPFIADSVLSIYEKILSGKIEWIGNFDLLSKDLIRKLLTVDRTRRLGSLKNGAEDVKHHRWFSGIEWDKLYSKSLKAPIIPVLEFDGDTRNFNEYPENDWNEYSVASKEDLKFFQSF